MWEMMGLLATFFIIKGLLAEKMEKPAPPGTRVDLDKMREDIHNGMPPKVAYRRCEKGYYNTTEPKKDIKRLDVIDDVELYEADKKRADLTKENIEHRVKTGYYKRHWY